MSERIYRRSHTGDLETYVEKPFESEDELQALIASHPEVMSGELIDPSDPLRWILIAREMGVAESVEASYRWSLDHLFIDQYGTPTLVEVKLRSNTEIRRTVVGQLLDYAANAAETWSIEEIREAFERHTREQGNDPASSIREFAELPLGNEHQFCEKVETKLNENDFRLLFVSDNIPDQLERIVTFLNAQMQIEVGAVEIKPSASGTSRIYLPRVIGCKNDGTVQSSPRRSRLTRQRFLDDFPEGPFRNAAETILKVTEEAGGKLQWGSSALSIRGQSPSWSSPITVAWLRSPSFEGEGGQWFNFPAFSFGNVILSYDSPPGPGLTAVLKRWIELWANEDFTKKTDDKNVWSVDYEDVVTHLDLITNRIREVLQQLRNISPDD